MSAISRECRKSKHAWILLTVAVFLVLLNTANGVVNYLDNASIFKSQHLTWQGVWAQGALMWSVLFLPFLITMRAASMTRMEHEQANWRRLASYGAQASTYRGKLGLLSIFVLCCQGAFFAITTIASLLLDFSLTFSDVFTMLAWCAAGVIGGITIAAIQLAVGVIMRSFATTLAIGIIGAVGGLMIIVAVPPMEAIYPYAQIVAGMRVSALDWMSIPGMVWFLGWNAVLTGTAVLAGRLALRWKEH